MGWEPSPQPLPPHLPLHLVEKRRLISPMIQHQGSTPFDPAGCSQSAKAFPSTQICPCQASLASHGQAFDARYLLKVCADSPAMLQGEAVLLKEPHGSSRSEMDRLAVAMKQWGVERSSQGWRLLPDLAFQNPQYFSLIQKA